MKSLVTFALVAFVLLSMLASGADLALSMRDVALVTLARTELKQIARQVTLQYSETGTLPEKTELARFLRARLRTPGRDPGLDRWQMPYWLETVQYQSRKLNTPRMKGEFVLLSAGPDRVWLSQDDLVIASTEK